MPGLFAYFSNQAALIPAILGGVLPALVWLAFWLREDRERPEPRRAILITFLLGVASVPAAMVVQLVITRLAFDTETVNFERMIAISPLLTLAVVAGWVVVEEAVKLLAAYSAGLSRAIFDEPVDAAVYLIAAALGFAAAENVFYVLKDTHQIAAPIAQTFLTASSRAVGATTLHVAVAALLGVFGGYAHYATPRLHRLIWVSGFALVSLLHLAFNALIIFDGSDAANAAAFAVSWTVTLVAIVALEKLKAMRVEKPSIAPNQR